MTMSYPQQQYPPQPPTAPSKSSKRGVWIVVVIGAFILGVAVGLAGNSTGSGTKSARETVTVRVPAGEGEAPPAEPAQAEASPPAPAGPAATMSSGIYQVGVDVQAGQYKTAGPEDNEYGLGCYWARLKNDTGEFDAIISNGNLDGPGSFTVNAGEFVELSGDCTWTKTG
ncbi:MAG: hypothetical protein WBA97_00820 [Actinophytocola sp.]|uniref:hypothetical protein n=1 Tax=Actinophytocola sp. TaxID=1872138 RepID=UPI003C72007D